MALGTVKFQNCPWADGRLHAARPHYLVPCGAGASLPARPGPTRPGHRPAGLTVAGPWLSGLVAGTCHDTD